MTGWIRTYEDPEGFSYVEDLGGVSWLAVKPPGWLHTCQPQTRGHDDLDFAERCACGARRVNYGDWEGRNQRRRDRILRRGRRRVPGRHEAGHA